jgi:hypothetical protein
MRQYSNLFETIYDQTSETFGHNYHFSILRTITWSGYNGAPLIPCMYHDICVVWDEDHDTRVIYAIEEIYKNGLLYPIIFIGEGQGFLNAHTRSQFKIDSYYSSRIDQLTNNEKIQDCWGTEVSSFNDRSFLYNIHKAMINYAYEYFKLSEYKKIY